MRGTGRKFNIFFKLQKMLLLAMATVNPTFQGEVDVYLTSTAKGAENNAKIMLTWLIIWKIDNTL